MAKRNNLNIYLKQTPKTTQLITSINLNSTIIAYWIYPPVLLCEPRAGVICPM